ncbi:protein translocase subunit SecDF [Nonlabens marinus]|uniref:Multifunctional fusion protein n=1 Tax=Nonlabens marinus S1-08 TaxID=1454201 RepID=W8VRA0_9FLAO|nr:protein translocase subunit SecDF [Nonlabens marinus]BAO55535.1 protein-export membrane protein SecD / Protein-export membrane protein SecF [Nonlabens marinus S1-08]
MQNKGLIRFFAIIFAAVCIYQLTYTFITYKVEKDAEAYAERVVDRDAPNAPSLIEEARKRYLDSVSNKDVWGGYTTYAGAKEDELKKGLDLKGGINVILQISIRDLLIGMADGSTDGDFRTALDRADERVKDGQQDYFDYFIEEFEAIEGAQLASPDIFANQEMEGRINFDMSNSEVEPVLREELQSYMVSAFDVLRKRIDKFGTTQPNIQQLGSSGRILIEMPGEKDVKRVKQLLVGTALLEFWHVYKASEVAPYLVAADTYWADKIASENTGTVTDSAEVAVDSTAVAQEQDNSLESLLNDEVIKEDNAVVDQAQYDQNPILSRVLAPGNGSGPIIATFRASDQELIQGYLNDPQARGKLPADQRFIKFAWGRPELNDELGYELIDLYAIRGNSQGEAPLSGGVITNAKQDYDINGKVIVSMSMNSEGAKIWEQMTTEAFQNQTQVAVVLDNTVYSAPGITNGPISGGNSQISGNFTVPDAEDLATVLKAGKLPAKAEIIQSEVIGPSLGQEAINSGLWSFAIALLLVLVWMFFYYGRAGLYADVALLVNILFIFGALASFGAVLTLPGIAGIVLTIGISVDANVLIFERIKEELAKGKSQADSIKDGFNNALSSILDANITTFLTAAILYIFGTGPIQGFATTLMIGILTSLFTAIFITRLFIDGYGKNGKSLAFTSAMTKSWFVNVRIDFLKMRKTAYAISGVLILASIVSLATLQLNFGIDFTGGRKYTVRFEQDMNATEVTSILSSPDVFGSAEAKTYGADNQLAISTKYGIEMDDTEASADIESKLYTNLKQFLPADMTQEEFGDVSLEGKEYGIMSNFQVGPTIADDILTGSLYAIFGSLIVVFLYILIRFRRWQFSLGAVAAVFHDVIIVLGVFSATYKVMPFNMEIDQAFIAAILTVIGYSLNDTVVVFDRIREYIAEKTNWDFARTVNGAISSTISRTINTSLTTLIVLLAIFIFGGESIRGFMFALIIGVIVGTYSSVFIATPIMYDTLRKTKARPRKSIPEKDAQ